MKKFLCFILSLIVIFSGCFVVIVSTVPEMPDIGIYNYFGRGDATPFIVLKDYITVFIVPDTHIVCRKDLTDYHILADSAFDAKKKLPFLLGAEENNLVYTCMEQTGGRTYYSINLDTYEKVKLKSENSVNDTSGFLGVHNILGIVLDSKDVYSYMNAGSFWVNSAGVHSAKQTREYLSEFDKEEEYGIYNNMDKIAETNESVFFLNFFGELIRFNKTDKTFEHVLNKIIDDFYITNESIYYVYNSELYETDYEGKKETKVCDFAPKSINYDDGKIYVSDNNGTIFLVKSDSVVKICDIKSDYWTVSEGKIYYYIPNETRLGCVFNGKDSDIIIKSA